MTSAPGPLAAQRARNARLLVQAESLAAAHAAAHAEGQAAGHAGPEGGMAIPVVLLPANTRPIVAVPAAARAAFLAHLDGVLARAFAVPLRDDRLPTATEDAAAPAAARADARADAGELMSRDSGLPAAMVSGGCGTCRGACCTAGGTHAFLTPDSLVRVRAQRITRGGATGDTPEALAARYAAALPATHYRASCVFHARAGCTLPRDLRANLCNRYQCGGLTQLSRALAARGAEAAYVAAGDSVRLRRLAYVGPSGCEGIAVRAPGV